MFMRLDPSWKSFPRHWSTWLGVATILADSAYIFIDGAGDLLSPRTVIMLNAAVAVGMKILQMLKQDIPLTPEVKTALVEHVKATATELPGGEVLPGKVIPGNESRPPAITPAENTERLKTFIEMTVGRMVREEFLEREDALARKRRPKALARKLKPHKPHVEPEVG